MSVSPQVREEVLEFLYREAECLDSGRFEDWLAMMTVDVQYRMPVRMTRERGDAPDRSDQMQFFWDDRTTLELRVRRLRTDFAWAEDPPSRTRHFVSNVRIAPAPGPEVLDVRSYVLITRNRGDAAGYEIISGERRDVLRRADGAWKLARREFLVDQAMLGVKNLGIFV
ncbi:MAG: aromatic-ring-hydroxylating dioxygenase subunit beta [bacterium]